MESVHSIVKIYRQSFDFIPLANWQMFIACLFSWCATITRQVEGRFQVFLLLSFKPNYYKRLESDFILHNSAETNIPIHWWLTGWQYQLSLLLEVLQNRVDILKGFIDFCSHLKSTMWTRHNKMILRKIETFAPVRTTLPETKMRRTIRGFTILMMFNMNRIFISKSMSTVDKSKEFAPVDETRKQLRLITGELRGNRWKADKRTNPPNSCNAKSDQGPESVSAQGPLA